MLFASDALRDDMQGEECRPQSLNLRERALAPSIQAATLAPFWCEGIVWTQALLLLRRASHRSDACGSGKVLQSHPAEKRKTIFPGLLSQAGSACEHQGVPYYHADPRAFSLSLGSIAQWVVLDGNHAAHLPDGLGSEFLRSQLRPD